VRLLSHLVNDDERLAVVVGEGVAVDVADVLGAGPWTMGRLLSDTHVALERLRSALTARHGSVMEISSLNLLAPVPRPGKVLAAGRNYRDHAAEEETAPPLTPLLFAKLPSSLVGHRAEISWSSEVTAQVDYEAELAVVIGREASNVDVSRAFEYVLGYTCLNDVSARDLQEAEGQWTRAKGLDTFCPMGPWLVTADEIGDPRQLRVRCRVNGELRQDSSAREMVHGVAELVAFCSRSFTLEAGDILATGTPAGVGAFREPPVYLTDGDVVEVEIDRIGTLRNPCRVTNDAGRPAGVAEAHASLAT
jgi:2-keto-4-pentenoate hydratase/2-oxohepta-3-ene-1,7-dioic acid hydratase in catechol pathway